MVIRRNEVDFRQVQLDSRNNPAPTDPHFVTSVSSGPLCCRSFKCSNHPVAATFTGNGTRVTGHGSVSNRHMRRYLAVVVLFLLAAGPVAAIDEFTERHARALAANPTIGFSVRFKDGRKTFRVGERISLELLYSPAGGLYVNRTHAERCLRIQFDQPVTAHPRIDTDRFFDGVPGGILGGILGGTLSPESVTTIDATLTNLYVFDAPGRYRLFVESKQRKNDFEISNILEFEILPRDPEWEADVVRRAETTLATRRQDFGGLQRTFAELRSLRSNEAVAILARFFEGGTLSYTGDGEIWHGLVAGRDRAFVLDALHRELKDAARTLDPWFYKGLAHLVLDTRLPPGAIPSHDQFLATLDDLAMQRAQALSAVPGRLEAELHREINRYTGGDGEHIPDGVARVARRFPAEATAAFKASSAEGQRGALTGGWKRFNDPMFLPLVRSAYEFPAEGSQRVRDVALRRLYELAPQEGRTAMLAELRRPRPRVSVAVLAVLPDPAFPELERRWLQQLQSSRDADRRVAAQRIERFATAKLAADVERFYRRVSTGLRCGTRSALLAYMVRADVRSAERLLTEAATKGFWDDTCERALISEVADLEWSAAVEGAAIVALAHSDPALVSEAARVLAKRGSLAARAPLEQRLRSLIATARSLSARKDAASDRRRRDLAFAARDVAYALAGAKSWLLTSAERREFRELCKPLAEGVTCAGAFAFGDGDRPHVVEVRSASHGFLISVDAYPTQSLADLREKLRQFPAGARLFWDDHPMGSGDTLDRWTRAERDRLFAEFQREAATHGVILHREQTARGLLSDAACQ